MDPAKVKVIEDWEEPLNERNVRVFIWMTNYYRKFVEGYYRIVKPLTKILKKDRPSRWIDKNRHDF